MSDLLHTAAKIDRFAHVYLEMTPNYHDMKPDQVKLILFEFMDKIHRDWDGEHLGPLPILGYHDPIETAVEAGSFSHGHPEVQLRGKRARLGVLTFDPQRYKISWAWMNDQGTYQPAKYVDFLSSVDLERAREAAATAYDAAERQAVQQHNIKVLIHLARRELLIDTKKLPPTEYGTPLVRPILVSDVLTYGRGWTTHVTARSE